MNPFGYSDAVWRLFRETPRAGVLDGAALTGSATTPASRGRLRLQVRVKGSQIADARFQAYGCPTTIAVGAWLAEHAVGRSLTDLAGLRAADIRQALEIPEARLHCALLGEDAIKSLCRSAS
jgi:NifU-like protein involved in Fe-S cluster formation